MILRSLQQYPTDNACGTVRAVGQSCETHTSHYRDIIPITPVGRSELWDRAVRLIHHTTEMILRSLQQYPTDNACGTVRAVGQSCETHTSHYRDDPSKSAAISDR